MILDPHFWIFPSIIDKELCDLIIKRGNEMETEPGQAGGEVMLDKRKSHVAWFDQNDWVSGLCYHYTKLANEQAWDFDITHPDGVQFTNYGVGEFYEPHTDTHRLEDDMRKLSIVIQLNSPDDYEGGEFMFFDGDKPWSPENFEQQGSVLVFPSFLLHQVKPVTSGKRHSIVSWFVGPQMK